MALFWYFAGTGLVLHWQYGYCTVLRSSSIDTAVLYQSCFGGNMLIQLRYFVCFAMILGWYWAGAVSVVLQYDTARIVPVVLGQWIGTSSALCGGTGMVVCRYNVGI